MEETDESTEGLFSRLYANMFARHLATSDPQIQKIFELWKNTETLTSPLERNADLFKTLLSETPWIRDAVDETAARLESTEKRRVDKPFGFCRKFGQRFFSAASGQYNTPA